MSSKQTIIVGGPDDVVAVQDENLSRALSLEQRSAEVKERAVDLFDHGQTQPVRAYNAGRGKPHVYIGHTRVAAVALIRAGFQVPTGETETVPVVGGEEGQVEERPIFRTIHNAEFPLAYVVDEITEQEATVRGLADNFQNFKPNDLDLAHAAKGLQDKYGYNDKQVTELLGVSDPFKVGRVKKLLRAPAVVQEAVQAGKLATATALEIVESEGDGRKAAVKLVKEAVEGGADAKFPTQGQIRKAINTAAEETGSTGTTKKAPGGADIRDDFKVLFGELDGDESIPENYKTFLGEMNRYLNAKITFKTLTAKMDEAFGVKPAKPKATPKAKAPKTAKGEEDAVFGSGTHVPALAAKE